MPHQEIDFVWRHESLRCGWNLIDFCSVPNTYTMEPGIWRRYIMGMLILGRNNEGSTLLISARDKNEDNYSSFAFLLYSLVRTRVCFSRNVKTNGKPSIRYCGDCLAKVGNTRSILPESTKYWGSNVTTNHHHRTTIWEAMNTRPRENWLDRAQIWGLLMASPTSERSLICLTDEITIVIKRVRAWGGLQICKIAAACEMAS